MRHERDDCALSAMLALFAASAVAAERKEPTAGEVAKMQAAAPERPRVAAERPRKVLIFSISWGYKHDSIPYGEEVFEILGKKIRRVRAGDQR